MLFLQIRNFFLLIVFASFSSHSVFAQTNEERVREGADPGTIQEMRAKIDLQVEKEYLPAFGVGCSNYQPVGICILPIIPIKIKIMSRYWVPFQITEHSNRPGASALADKQTMKMIREKEYRITQNAANQEIPQDHALIEQQKLQNKKGKITPGKSSQGAMESLQKHKDKDHYSIGIAAEEGYTTSFNAVHSNHEWHNKKRDQSPYNDPESPFVWCHNYSKHPQFCSPSEEHPEIPLFTSLGAKDSSGLKQYIPLINKWAKYSINPPAGLQDLKERTPKAGDPVLTACYQKETQTGRVPRDIPMPESQKGKEMSPKVCPGNGFLGPAGPFWHIGKSLYTAGNAMMGSLRGLIVAWNTMEDKQKRHQLHSYTGEYGHPSDYMQRLWPMPPLEGWPAGCDDTKNEGSYIPPKIRPIDNGEANITNEQNFGNHHIFAHYTSITCCPCGWIPIGPPLKLK